MQPVARLGDRTMGSCSVHGSGIGGTISSASSTITVNNIPAARLGDTVDADCGHVATIISAGMNTDPNNKGGIARLNDQVGNSPYTATIVSASSTVKAN